jgi:hypothetical protein
MRLAALFAVFAVFTGWSLTVVDAEGFGGLFALVARERWAAQLTVDLSISLFVAWSWLRPEARSLGIPAWPYVIGTVALGSIAVLAFLIHREFARRSAMTVTKQAGVTG